MVPRGVRKRQELLRFAYFLARFITVLLPTIRLSVVKEDCHVTGHSALVSVDPVPYQQAVFFVLEIEDEFNNK